MKEVAKQTALAAVAFFSPIQQLVLLTTVLIFFDTITGVWAALRRGERFKSARFGDSVAKIVLYTFALCTAHIVQVAFAPEIPVVRLTATVIGLREATSVFENLDSLQGGNLYGALISLVSNKRKK